jgi:DNA end-binding protein Ku
VPAGTAAARRPYVLLLDAMKERGVGAMGRFVQAGKEKLCLIRPKGDALALETLFLAEDVYSQAEIDEAVEGTEVRDPELDLARQLVDSLVGEFDPGELTSDYRRDLRALLEAKLEGAEIARPEPVTETPVIDLMDALKRSVAEAKQRKPVAATDGAAGQKAATRRRAAARSK